MNIFFVADFFHTSCISLSSKFVSKSSTLVELGITFLVAVVIEPIGTVTSAEALVAVEVVAEAKLVF